MHPIAVVYVQDVSDQSMIRTMNVSADDTVGSVIACRREHRTIAKVREELDRLARRLTQIIGKRTAFVACLIRSPIVPIMDPLSARVSVRANFRQQAIQVERSIELMTMNHQHLGAVGGAVNQRSNQRQAAKQVFNQAGISLVVISRNEYYVYPAPPPLLYFIHQLLLRWTPLPCRSAVPSIDDVANQVESLGNVMAQEIE
jgi:hypothetical protein